MNTPYLKTSAGAWRTTAATIGLLAAVVVSTADLTAQRRSPAQRPATGATAVETALRLADRLELAQEQRDQLEAIRVELLEQRAAQSTRLMTLNSEVRAGISERGAIREELAAMREQGEENRTAQRARYAEIFTDEQTQQLQRLNRMSAWRQQGARRGPGMDRGRGIRGRGPADRGRGGNRFRGSRRPGGSGRERPQDRRRRDGDTLDGGLGLLHARSPSYLPSRRRLCRWAMAATTLHIRRNPI